MQKFIVLIFVLAFLTACAQDEPSRVVYERPGYRFGYNLSQPDQTWKLPLSLFEISGNSYIDDQRLACIQDEKGIIFIYNLKDGKIESEINFEEDGDYEDIQVTGKDAWILKSNGKLYKVEDFRGHANAKAKKYPTALSSNNNTEGLAYDPALNSLLIACKDDPFLDETKGKGARAVYRFRLDNHLLEPMPFLLIRKDTLEYYLSDALGKTGQGFLNEEGGFKPSGIAIQPGTGNIFILASVGKLLMVLTGEGKILALARLSPQVFRQPEGICFSPDGTLYISSEGAGQDGRIMKFSPE